MSTRATPSFGATGGGQYKRKLETLGFPLVTPAPAKTPGGQQVANAIAPKKSYVCILGKDDYMAVTKLASCTGLALFDAASNLGGVYHFGGQFNSEPVELAEFAGELRKHTSELGNLHMWLFGSTKCGFANKLLDELRSLGFNQKPVVMQIDGATHPEAAFYLLGTGVVTDELT